MSVIALQRDIVNHLVHVSREIGRKIDGIAEPRLAVYHNAYRMQLLGCLHDTFEKTWSWLGDSGFDEAALQHIESHPPQSWTLSDYGENFDATLSSRFPNDPEVAELAWLDWSLRRAFDGPDARALNRDDLAAVDWEAAILRLVPTLRFRPITTNCAAIWSAIADGDAPPAATVLPAPMALRVWRQELAPRFRSIGPVEHQALTATVAGESFANVCSVAEGKDPVETSSTIASFLAAWIQDGLITQID